jgi:hypothetical protein
MGHVTEPPQRPAEPSVVQPQSPPPVGVDAPPVTPVPPTPLRTNETAIASLVCAVGSWILLPVILSVIALVLAGRAERAIEADAFATGQGLVTAARWVAWVNLLVVAMLVAFVSAFAVALGLGR